MKKKVWIASLRHRRVQRRLQMASARAGSSTAAAPSFFATFSFSGRAGNIAAAARRVALRRWTRARQSMSTMTAASNASAPRTPPTIAGTLEDELCDGSCVEDSPGTDVWVVVGVAGAARVPGWPALTSVASVCGAGVSIQCLSG